MAAARKTTTLTIRVSPDLITRIKAATDNRNKFILEAIEEKLNPVHLPAELTPTEQKNAIRGAKTLTDVMQDLILQEAQRRQNFLSRMDDETFAKLVAGRLPKEQQDAGEVEADVLSLRACLDQLPDVSDLSDELKKVKGELFKAERERDLNRQLLAHGENKVELGELMELVYRSAVEYAADLIARRELPGFGDGGGLTPQAYAEIAADVKAELDRLLIYRRKP